MCHLIHLSLIQLSFFLLYIWYINLHEYVSYVYSTSTCFSSSPLSQWSPSCFSSHSALSLFLVCRPRGMTFSSLALVIMLSIFWCSSFHKVPSFFIAGIRVYSIRLLVLPYPCVKCVLCYCKLNVHAIGAWGFLFLICRHIVRIPLLCTWTQELSELVCWCLYSIFVYLSSSLSFTSVLVCRCCHPMDPSQALFSQNANSYWNCSDVRNIRLTIINRYHKRTSREPVLRTTLHINSKLTRSNSVFFYVRVQYPYRRVNAVGILYNVLVVIRVISIVSLYFTTVFTVWCTSI